MVAREALLNHAMVELADSLVDDFDLVDLLTTLTERCVEILDVSAAGITLVDPHGDLHLMTSTSEERCGWSSCSSSNRRRAPA